MGSTIFDSLMGMPAKSEKSEKCKNWLSCRKQASEFSVPRKMKSSRIWEIQEEPQIVNSAPWRAEEEDSNNVQEIEQPMGRQFSM